MSPPSPNRRRSTTERGYGWDHQKHRAHAIASFRSGQPCTRCGQGIANADDAELDHNDDRTGYRGLSHSWCNREAGGRAGGSAARMRDEHDGFTDRQGKWNPRSQQW